MTTDLDAIVRTVPGQDKAERRIDGWWIAGRELDVVALATAMREREGRLTTMTAIGAEGSEQETVIIYHYVLGGAFLHARTETSGNRIASVAAVLPAADWIEREIHDLYGVEFTGRPQTERLLRPPELEPGFFRR